MIPCICIDDKNRPKEVPPQMWIMEGIEYHITHVQYFTKQNNIQGVYLHEVKIKNCPPYEAYRLSRFAFKEEDVPKLIQLMKDCTELNDIDINKLLEQELVTHE